LVFSAVALEMCPAATTRTQTRKQICRNIWFIRSVVWWW